MGRHHLENPAQIIDPRLRTLLDYWNTRRGARALPARADFNPADVPRLLSNIVLVAVSGEPPRFRFRVVGSEIVARYGAELTGRDLEEIDLGSQLGSVRSQYEETVREAAPTYCRHEIETADGKFLRYERLLLPLSSDGVKVDMMLGGLYMLPMHAEVRAPQR